MCLDLVLERQQSFLFKILLWQIYFNVSSFCQKSLQWDTLGGRNEGLSADTPELSTILPVKP